MTCFSVQPMYRISVKGYGFLSLAKNMGRNFGKNISENLSSKYSQKIFDHVTVNLLQMYFELLQKE